MTGEIIDYSVFPDLDTLPTDFSTIEARADYIVRICGAWDFGIIATRAMFALLKMWRNAFDAFPVPASPAYTVQADYEPIDARDGRLEDPCREMI